MEVVVLTVDTETEVVVGGYGVNELRVKS